MAWQEIPTTVFRDQDGTHYYVRAEEWPGWTGDGRFWIDVEYANAAHQVAASAKYLLDRDSELQSLRALMGILIDGSGNQIERCDWLDKPRDFGELCSREAMGAICQYVDRSRSG
jgi:hypothetical protein